MDVDVVGIAIAKQISYDSWLLSQQNFYRSAMLCHRYRSIRNCGAFGRDVVAEPG